MKLPFLWPEALVVVSGALYALLLPPFEQHALAWVTLVPLLLALASTSARRGFGLGLLWALVATVGVAWWFPGMVERFFGLSPVLSWLGLLGLGVLVDGLPYACFGLWLGYAARRGIASPWLIAAAWGVAEWLRANGPVANPFAQIAYSQSGSVFSQTADLAGPYGVGMLIVAMNAALAGLIHPRLGASRAGRQLAIASGLVLLAAGYGQLRLQQDFGEGESIRVALVQGAVARELEWDVSTREANLERYLQLTREAGALEPDVIFWPEFAVDFYLREPTLERARLLDEVRAVGADLVLGGSHYRFVGSPSERRTDYLNSVFVVDSLGRLRTDRYDKRRLTPFAEYGPFGDGLRAKTAVYVPGSEPKLLRVRGHQIGAFICGEALYPEIARELSNAGAEILANPSNDYWFGHPQAAAHQLQVASFRAIENRRYLVRPTSTGISAVVDPHGRALTHSKGAGPEVLHASLRPSSAVTLYQRVGDLPVLAAALLVAAGTWLGRRRATIPLGGNS